MGVSGRFLMAGWMVSTVALAVSVFMLVVDEKFSRYEALCVINFLINKRLW